MEITFKDSPQTQNLLSILLKNQHTSKISSIDILFLFIICFPTPPVTICLFLNLYP